jgi:peptidoglycan/xylan/chitin deacetylase (PgdA/CDA1 family)
MADNLATMSAGAINRRTLADAYEFLLQTLDAVGVRVTAAFVSGFASHKDALRDALPEIEALASLCPEWFDTLMPRLRRGDAASLDGLEGHCLWRQFRDSGHEMAWHGASHVSLQKGAARELIEAELLLATKLQTALGHHPTTVIFPRNLVGNLSLLRAAGFDTYRAGHTPGGISRALNLARELNLWDQPDRDLPRMDRGWRVSPPGHFLNWPSGIRRLVPVEATVRRWHVMLRSAAIQGRCVHMWFHPHNLITAPKMRDSFTEIMKEVSSLVKLGDLKNLTIKEANSYYGLE